MEEKYVNQEEYSKLFITLKRADVAKRLKLGEKILDLATGSGYFAIEVAKKYPNAQIIGIDIFEGSVKQAKKNVSERGLEDRIQVIKMDASELKFSDDIFDTVINYLGFEDIYMTKGMAGIIKTVREVYRVLKPSGRFYFVAMPVDEMETQPQKLEVEVFSWICNATWLTFAEYLDILKKAGFIFLGKESFYTGKKLTVEQAIEEIKYACKYVLPHYGVKTPSFDQVWERFKDRILEYGLGHYSKTILFEAMKPN